MSAAGPPDLAARVATSLLQVVVALLGAPLLLGLMAKVRARAEGRVGAPIRQPLLDLRKLVRKERIHAEHSGPVLAVAPAILVASTAVAVAVSPLLSTSPLLASSSDLFVVVFLLLTGSIAIALAGLDAGTAFGGMGASRSVTIGALAEPALLVAVLALSIQARSSNLPVIVSSTLAHPASAASPGRLLALAAMLVVVVAETGRLPVDNPSTHLELTMVHEAMVLEYAGPDLGLVVLGEAMRLGLLFSLLSNLFLPWGVARTAGVPHLLVALLALAAKAASVAVGIAILEVGTAKLRLFRVPELLAAGFVLAALGVVTELATR